MSEFTGSAIALALLAAALLACWLDERGWSLRRPRPTATELTDPGRDDLDSAHWLALKAAIGSPPAGERPDLKERIKERGGSDD